MKKLISVISLAIAAIAGYKSTIKSQQEEISQLRARVGNEDADDAARDNELKQARQKQAQLDADIDEANKKGDELASLLNSEPAVPSVDPATFQVTQGPTVGVEDLEFRARQEETAGTAQNVAFPSAQVNQLETEVASPATTPTHAATETAPASNEQGNSENSTPSDRANQPEGERGAEQK